MKAYTQDDILLKLEGNPDCQSSGGRLCGKGQAAIELLYDPDRLKYPLKRTNPEKGHGVDPKWQRISWEEAYDTIAKKLSTAIEKSGAHSIVYLGKTGGYSLPQALGTPNIITHNATCDIVEDIAYNLAAGTSALIPDLSKCNYVLAFGWDMPGKGKNIYERKFSEFLERQGTKAVIFDPRLSYTASKAHEWVPVKPTGDLAVSLAMLNTIIKENLYDKAYVEKFTIGFEEVAEGVKEYTPEWAAKISEVPAETIVRIAREFATTKPAVIPMYKRGVYNLRRQGFALAQTHLCMMAITGNIEVEGGAIFNRKFTLGTVAPKKTPPVPAMKKRIDGAEGKAFDHHVKSIGMMQVLPDAILSGKPYPIECMIIYNQGMFSFSDTAKAEKALAKVPFLVNINVLPDEMAMMADIVLPETTFLEKSSVVVPKSCYYPQVTARQPVVKSLYETQSASKMYQGILAKMGLADYLPPSGDPGLDPQLEPLGIKFADLKKMGVFKKEGPFKAKDLTTLKTASGKLELAWESMKEHDYSNVPKDRKDYHLSPDGEYTFYITTTRSPLNRHNTTCNSSWIHEAYPENKLQMNASKAAEMGIGKDDWVRVKSSVGMVTMKVDLTEGIRPDTVCIPHGFGHWSTALTKACSHGVNDGYILPDRTIEEMIAAHDPCGNAADCDIMVKVSKA
jgi:thiosulfate reductase/polysulfide reductase chain A